MAKFLMLSKDHAITSLIRSRHSTVVRWVFRTLNTNRESRVEELDVTTANIVINSKCCWASAPSPYSLTCSSCPHKLTSQDWNCNKDFILCFFGKRTKKCCFYSQWIIPRHRHMSSKILCGHEYAREKLNQLMGHQFYRFLFIPQNQVPKPGLIK